MEKNKTMTEVNIDAGQVQIPYRLLMNVVQVAFVESREQVSRFLEKSRYYPPKMESDPSEVAFYMNAKRLELAAQNMEEAARVLNALWVAPERDILTIEDWKKEVPQ